MKQKLKDIIKIIFPKKSTVIDVNIEDCRHYCGFLYGKNSIVNPYQDYIVGLKNGIVQATLKDKFIHFLSVYRPKSINEALDISLSKTYPLWLYPWSNIDKRNIDKISNWLDEPLDVIDIITYYSKKGVYKFKIEQEFIWLERALKSIQKYGYAPDKFMNYATVLQLKANDGKACYILLDGNHRAAALYAMGQTHISCILEKSIHEKDIKNWGAVKAGYFTESDAHTVFHAYINGNTKDYYGEAIKAKLTIIE